MQYAGQTHKGIEMDGESFNFDNTDNEFLASMYASAKLSATQTP